VAAAAAEAENMSAISSTSVDRHGTGKRPGLRKGSHGVHDRHHARRPSFPTVSPVVGGHARRRVHGAHCDQRAPLLRETVAGEREFASFVESDGFFGSHGEVASLCAGFDLEMPSDRHFSRFVAAAWRCPRHARSAR
jgi:hypothetical protein